MQDDIRKAKCKSDFVILYPHVGGQFNLEPGKISRYVFDKAVEVGVDAIIASHPHIVQKADMLNGVPCFYSVGNFSMSPNSVYLLKEHNPEFGLAVHIYLQENHILVKFSILKIIEDKNTQLQVWPVNLLYETLNRNDKVTLEEDIKKIYRRVTGNELKTEIVKSEYEYMKIKKKNTLNSRGSIKMNKAFELAKICLYSIISGFGRKKIPTKVIFIPFFGHLGDMVMFLDVLEEYKKLYSKEKGYRLVLGCRKEAWDIICLTGNANNVEYIEMTREKFDQKNYFIDRVCTIKILQPEIIINVRENNAIEHVFLHAIPACKKYTYRSFPITYANKIGSLFSKCTYTKIWSDTENKDQISCYADMVRLLGRDEYKSKIARFPFIPADIKDIPEEYIAISPGASVGNKCWPVDRYIKVVNYLCEKVNLYIVLCGGGNDVSVSSQIYENAKYKDRLVNITGKTTIKEWIAVLQKARFVITNESGSIHIAASCGVPSLCIGEQKYSNKWLPYRVEEVRDNDCMPKVVRGEKLPCEFCASRNFQFDIECKNCYQKNGVVRCVYEITEDMVIREIDEYVTKVLNRSHNVS